MPLHLTRPSEACWRLLQFQSYIHRNPVPYQASGSDNPLWYSVNLGDIHMVYLSNCARPESSE